MKFVVFFFLGLFSTLTLKAQENRDITYIRNHALIAVKEMQLYKIPASIKLAQGLLETGGGQSRLAEKANNHFGIKCKNEWPADKPRIYHDDDAKGECFRGYQNVQESYRDHSEFLALRPYYKALFKLDIKDYKAWAHGLKKAGYATDASYASKLISRIEKYNLNQFDDLNEDEVYAKLYLLYGNEKDKYLVQNNVEKEVINQPVLTVKNIEKPIEKKLEPVLIKEKPEIRSSLKVEERPNHQNRILRHPNNISYIVAEAGESLTSIGKLFRKSPIELADYNEVQLNAKLTKGQIIFFDKKKTKGYQNMYKVNEGDNMYTISQKFGIKISNLYKLNRMKPGDQPKEGEYISLQRKRA